MDRLLARLERGPLGKLAVERFTTFLVGAMFLVFLLGLVKGELFDLLTLDPHRALAQPWRFVSFLVIPPSRSLFWGIISIMWVHFIGSSLEANWGAFKYNVYYLVGAAGTVAAAFVTGGPVSNWSLYESLLWAVATLAPNYEIMFFVIPIRLKWVALLGVALVAFELITGDMRARIGIAISFANYLLFFAPDLVALAKGQQVMMKQAARRAATSTPAPAATSGRACAICGKRQDDGADIRVCSCEKCGGKARELCLEHARNH